MPAPAASPADRASRAVIVGACCSTIFMVAVDATVVNLAPTPSCGPSELRADLDRARVPEVVEDAAR